MTAALAIAAAGLITFVIGVVLDPGQAYFSYLTAYAFAIQIVLGALMLVLIEHLIAATWFVVMRRAAETIAAALPVFVPLFAPIAIGVDWLYPWTDPARLDAHARGLVELKRGYLNLPFFFVRAAVYFAVWLIVSERFRRRSLAQDHDDGGAWTERMRALSAPGLVVVGFGFAFAAIDWLMTLAPTWFSTIFPVQVFAGAVLAALALLALLVADERDASQPAALITPEHCSALGKMILTFAIFWAYTSFAQLLIVWIANLPDEVSWYTLRTTGGWLWIGLSIGAAEFMVPFALMLSYELKRRRRVLRLLGGWLLAAHYVETYWMVMPQLNPLQPRPHWLDASAAALVGGAAVACALWRARGTERVPVGDPDLGTSLRYSEA